MNYSKKSSAEQIGFLFRIPADIHREICRKVYLKKESDRKYSINKYLIELVMKDLYGEKCETIMVSRLLKELGISDLADGE